MSSVIPKFEVPPIPNSKEADKLIKPLISQSADLMIKDEDGYLASWALIEQHDNAIAKIGEWFNPFVNGLHQLHKMAVALRAQFLEPVIGSKNRLFSERKRYRAEQERIAQEKRDRDAEILRKAQAKEMEKEAKKLEKAGEVETATVLREQAKTLPAPVIPIAPAPRQEGSVLTTRWIATITDYEAVPIEYRTLDHTKKTERELIDSKIQGVVSKLGNQIKIAGVEIRQETIEHSRAVH